MELLLEINDTSDQTDISKFTTREASRAVIFDDKGNVPLLFVAKHNYHKLPGGGIEEGEDKIVAVKRECIEEVGSEVEIIKEIGMVVEFREEWKLKQISYCYLAKVLRMVDTNYTEQEILDGFKIEWVKIDDAIKLLEKDVPNDYEGDFIIKRDLAFLKAAKNF
jgi:8-oxo-dGTP pyrophosphatase MutT (NUDIX family)